MSTAADGSGREPLELLAEEFVARYRRGERPSVAEYADRCPELAEQIRVLFPTLAAMEEFGPPSGPSTGPYAEVPGGAGWPPQQLCEYRIVGEVGRGGMGVVYEAVQEPLGRRVALKVLPPGWAGRQTFLERFRREAKAAAKLHHTNIVPVFGVGEWHGVHYYAMQYIRGQGLNAVLAEVRRLRGGPGAPSDPAARPSLATASACGLLSGRFEPEPGDGDLGPIAGPGVQPPGANGRGGAGLSPPRPVPPDASSDLVGQSEARYYRAVARLGVQAAEALAYAHAHGVLHRDVKPSNLLLDTQGTLWVTDFGLAKADDSDDLTGTGDLIGTLRYMAPERFRGRADARSDVYALGLTLYELLTLRPAFTAADRPGLIDAVLHRAPAPPRRLDLRIPRDLETVVLKAVAKDPAERYPSAAALAEDLRRFLADRPILARRHTLPERLWRWTRRDPWVAGLLAAVLGLLLALLAGAYASARMWRQQSEEATRAWRSAEDRLAESLLEQARAIRLTRQVGQHFRALGAVLEAARIRPEPRLRLRNEAIPCLALPDLRPAREWPGAPPGTVQVAFDARLERYARRDRSGAVSLRRVSDGTELCRLTGLGPEPAQPGPVRPALRFSPDGRYLAATDAETSSLMVWEVGREAVVVRAADVYHGGVDFLPDGRRLAALGDNGDLVLYDLPAGRVRRFAGVLDEPSCLAFHPDGRHVACGGLRGDEFAVLILDAETGATEAELTGPNWPNVAAWHPAGRWLAVGYDGAQLVLWDVPRRQPYATLASLKERRAGATLAFSPSGDLLAGNNWEEVLRLWEPRTGRLLLTTPARSLDVAFGTDSRTLAGWVRDDRLGLWEVYDGACYRTLTHPPTEGPGNYFSTAVSPDGRLLAAGTDRGVRLWDLAAGAPVAAEPLGSTTSVLFEPSGTLLTNSEQGLDRWPVRADGAGGWRLGPPERLPVPASDALIAQSRDGRVLAVARHAEPALVLHADRPAGPVELKLGPADNVNSVSVSPDGRWVATGNRALGGGEAAVWDARTGACVRAWRSAGFSRVRFSPDGRWLAVGREGGCRVLASGTWADGPLVPGEAFCFAPDGTLAVETGRGAVQLVDPATGAEYARLEDPNNPPDVAGFLSFSGDGSLLVATDNESRSVHVWDLRRLRARLAALGLDW